MNIFAAPKKRKCMVCNSTIPPVVLGSNNGRNVFTCSTICRTLREKFRDKIISADEYEAERTKIILDKWADPEPEETAADDAEWTIEDLRRHAAEGFPVKLSGKKKPACIKCGNTLTKADTLGKKQLEWTCKICHNLNRDIYAPHQFCGSLAGV